MGCTIMSQKLVAWLKGALRTVVADSMATEAVARPLKYLQPAQSHHLEKVRCCLLGSILSRCMHGCMTFEDACLQCDVVPRRQWKQFYHEISTADNLTRSKISDMITNTLLTAMLSLCAM